MNQNLGIDINITYNCNLSCDYCFEKTCTKHECFNLDLLPYVEKLISNLIEHNNYQEITLGFWGGEALLYVDIMEEIAKLFLYICKKYHVRHNLFVYSNGTLLNDDILRFLSLYITKIQYSFDGSVLTTKQRTKSEKLTQKIIDNAIQLYKENINISLKSTLHPKDISHLYDTYLEMLELSRKLNRPYWFVNFVNRIEDSSIITPELLDILYEQCMRIANYQLYYGIDAISFFQPNSRFCKPGDNYFTIDTNGDIVPCHALLYDSKLKKETYVGNVQDKNIFTILLDYFSLMNKFYTYEQQVSSCAKCDVIFCTRCRADTLYTSRKTNFLDRWSDFKSANSCKLYRIVNIAAKYFRSKYTPRR